VSFLETVKRPRAFLEGHRRVSLRALRRELGLDLERAELTRLTSDEATRQRELREAHRRFTEIGALIRAAEVATQVGA
jgi:hypothetical protein